VYIVIKNGVSSTDEVVGNAPIVNDVDVVCMKVSHVNPIHQRGRRRFDNPDSHGAADGFRVGIVVLIAEPVFRSAAVAVSPLALLKFLTYLT